MRTFAAEVTAAIAASSHRQALAVRIVDQAGVEWLWTDWPSNLTLSVDVGAGPGNKTFLSAVLKMPTDPEYASPNSAQASIQIADALGTLRAAADAGLFRDAAFWLWEVYARGPAYTMTAALMLRGSVERPAFGELAMVEIQAGPSVISALRESPPRVGPTCWYTTTTQCAHALTCAKSVAACTANSQLANFGGCLVLLVAGTVLEFRDAATATGDSGGGAATTPTVIQGF